MVKKVLFEPQADTQKKCIDGHIKKRVKRVFPPDLGDFWPLARIGAKPVHSSGHCWSAMY